MNFLAHCLIPERAAPQRPAELMAGGFVGDFLKGPLPDDLPPALAEGVRLHRRIDAFSNEHPAIRASCARFPGPVRRYAPIVVDVVADHLLARHWARYHPAPLETFTAAAYAAIAPHHGWLPPRGQRLLQYMSEEDLLAGYRQADVMYRSLGAVLRRLRRPPDPAAVEAAVAACLPGLEADFLDYFPDLIQHAADWLAVSAGQSPQR